MNGFALRRRPCLEAFAATVLIPIAGSACQLDSRTLASTGAEGPAADAAMFETGPKPSGGGSPSDGQATRKAGAGEFPDADTDSGQSTVSAVQNDISSDGTSRGPESSGNNGLGSGVDSSAGGNAGGQGQLPAGNGGAPGYGGGGPNATDGFGGSANGGGSAQTGGNDVGGATIARSDSGIVNTDGGSAACAYTGGGKDSTICRDGFCTERPATASGDANAVAKPWEGPAYTYAFEACPEKQTYTPPCGDKSCFEQCAAKACVAGKVPDSYDCGLGIGIEINHPSGGDAGAVAITRDFQIRVSGAPGGTRIGIVTASDKEFCQPLPSGATSSLTTVALKKMVTNCYEGGTPQTAYAGEAIWAVQIYVPGDEKGAVDVDMCVVDIRP